MLVLFSVQSELEPLPSAAEPRGGQLVTLENALCVQPAVSPQRSCCFWVWDVVVILGDSNGIWRAGCTQGLGCPGASLWPQPFFRVNPQTGSTFCVCYRLSLFHSSVELNKKWWADFPLPWGTQLKIVWCVTSCRFWTGRLKGSYRTTPWKEAL